jgi:hypothetical protein
MKLHATRDTITMKDTEEVIGVISHCAGDCETRRSSQFLATIRPFLIRQIKLLSRDIYGKARLSGELARPEFAEA